LRSFNYTENHLARYHTLLLTRARAWRLSRGETPCPAARCAWWLAAS